MAPTDPSQTQDVLAERDVIEQMVADGELCSTDGEPCDFVTVVDPAYGADYDGNRGTRIEWVECRKCGEYPHD